MPTRDTLSVVRTRLRELVRRRPPSPMIADDRLRRSTLDMLDEIASPPACGPLLAELQASLADWLADDDPALSKRLIVTPPGDRNEILTSWAERHGHALLGPPDRRALLAGTPPELASLDGDDLLVIPALEHWMLRHANGLALVRKLLDALAHLGRRVLVGCNSWAWQYLKSAVKADAVLAEPQIFAPFDAHALQAWFMGIAKGHRQAPIRFRDADSGDNVLDPADDGTPHRLLYSLSARSRGIPWVAWRLWRQSLRRQQQDKGDSSPPDAAADNDSQTLWVIALEEFLLPGQDNTDTLLLLHALLLHGPLPRELLTAVLPSDDGLAWLPALVSAGIVERHPDQTLACAPAAYPAVRAALAAAGFPIATV